MSLEKRKVEIANQLSVVRLLLADINLSQDIKDCGVNPGAEPLIDCTMFISESWRSLNNAIKALEG